MDEINDDILYESKLKMCRSVYVGDRLTDENNFCVRIGVDYNGASLNNGTQ
jgi:hypothetical protein